MTNPSVILTPIANDSPTKRLPPLTDSAAGIGRLSQEQGFPPITEVPLELGGKAPKRDDMNGALNLLSQHTVHLQSGGLYLYNSALRYDKGCVIVLDDGITRVQSLVDDNPENPNDGLGSTWRAIDAGDLVRDWARRYAGAGIRILTNTVLTAEQVGNWVDVESNSVTTLPSVDSVPVGSTFVVRNSSPTFETVTVNSLGGKVGGLTSFPLESGELIEFSADPAPDRGWWITSRSQSNAAFSGVHIGIPMPFPGAVPPPGCLMMVGQAFSAAAYPLLAQVYPSLILPDLRGEFIRGWDNGRGVDPGRSLLSWQLDAIQNMTGSFAIGDDDTILRATSASGVFSVGGYSTAPLVNAGYAILSAYRFVNFDASGSVRTGEETRSRNVAFNYICRAK